MAFETHYRTHTCNDLKKSDIDQKVKLSGWVRRIRDHGGLIFIDLWDNYGITQIVFDPKKDKRIFESASKLKPESIVFIEGTVTARPKGTENKDIPTGEIEIKCTHLTIDSIVPELPYSLTGKTEIAEELRLKYRFIDLRNDRLHKNIILRSKVIAEMRKYMINAGFTEFQTPILTVSSPEGARDYLVPSRIHPGKFYALPQAPQQYKQLIMCSGFDKYFQIAPCFRDEDARADRSPGEFYQLDIEMSFIEQNDLFKIIEGLLEHLTRIFSKRKILKFPFPRITFTDAMNNYGTDKPDIRYDMKIQDITDIFPKSNFKVLAENTKKGHCIKAVVLENSADEPRSFFEKVENFVKELGAKGIIYATYKDNILKSPISKFLSEDENKKLASKLKNGDAVFISAGKWLETCKIIGQVRTFLANEKNIIPKDILAYCWVVDFPMFEFNEEEQKIDFSHNPFSMPQGGLDSLNNKDPLGILAYQYDIVCNGIELSSGAIRNHRPDIMYKAFEIAGYSKKSLEDKFGHMLNAFSFGAPPHGGIAPGVDRLVMIFAEEPNIREVIMFPMNKKAQELMVGSPSEVTEKQLKELHLKLDLSKKIDLKKDVSDK